MADLEIGEGGRERATAAWRGKPETPGPEGAINHGPEKSALQSLEAVVKDSFTLVMEARKGIPVSVAFDIAGVLQIHTDQLADILHLTTRTLRSYRQENRILNAAHSEQILKLSSLSKKGSQVFGEATSFRRWLDKPAYGLDDQVPLDLLTTSGGIDLVMEELDRIAYGDFA